MLYRTIKRPIYPDFCDVWVFEHNCSIDDIVFQPNETCDAMWADAGKIIELMNSGEFVPIDNSEYILDLIK